MKLTFSLIVAAFAASAAALPAPAVIPSAAKLEVRSPAVGTEQGVGENAVKSKSIQAKCWGNCGLNSPAVSLSGARWGADQLTFGQSTFSNFGQFTSTFDNFVSICQNSLGYWQSQGLQAQQFAFQFQQMITNFWQMLNQFSGGCSVCRGVGQSMQFQSLLSNFFMTMQNVLFIIQRQYWNQINLFQVDLRILGSCIQVIFGITQSLNIPFGFIFRNINMNLFNSCGIQLNQYQYYNQRSLFNSIRNFTPNGFNGNQWPQAGYPNQIGNGYPGGRFGNGYGNQYVNGYNNQVTGYGNQVNGYGNQVGYGNGF